MKKLLCIIAGVISLTCCTKHEVQRISTTDMKISFEAPVVKPATKASDYAGVIDGTTFPVNENFKVFAIKHTGDFAAWNASGVEQYFGAAGAVVDYDPTAAGWTSSPKYYWPKHASSKLSFQAYSPADLGGTVVVNETGVNISEYVVNPGKGVQNDILFSERVIDKTQNEGVYGTEYYGVQLPFHHALAQICFDAKLADGTVLQDNESITITSIVLKNVNSKGNFAQGLAATDGASVGVPVWSSQSTPITYDNIVATSPAKLPAADATDDEVAAYANATFTPILALPADFIDTVGEETQIIISYTTVLGAAGSEITEPIISEPILVKDLLYNGSAGSSYEIGKKYKYHITVGLNAIYFAPRVTEWINVDVTGGIAL